MSSTFCLFSAASALLLSISSFIFLFSSWERQMCLELRQFNRFFYFKKELSVKSIVAYVGGALFFASWALPDTAAHAAHFSCIYSKQTTVAAGNLKHASCAQVDFAWEQSNRPRVFVAANAKSFKNWDKLNDFHVTKCIFIIMCIILNSISHQHDRQPTIRNAADPDNRCAPFSNWFAYEAGQKQIQLVRANSYLQWSPASGKKKPFWKAGDM